MPNVPAQPARSLAALMAADVRDVLMADGEDAVNGWYRRKGNAPGAMADSALPVVPVTVAVGQTMEKMGANVGLSGRSGPAGLGQTGTAGARRVGVVMVPGIVPGETLADAAKGIGTEGNILQLADGDQLIVPGYAVGLADEAITLMVGGKVRPGAGSWLGEVTW